MREQLPGITAWREHVATPQFLLPIELNLHRVQWPPLRYDFVFTANTLHIVSWPLAIEIFRGAAITLRPGGLLFIYGPFNYRGAFTSSSNAQFDSSLRARDPHSGIRDFTAVVEALRCAGNAAGASIELCQDIAMPANNRLLMFKKS